MGFQITHNHISRFFTDIAVFINSLQQILGTNIGSKDDNGILKIYSTPLGISDTAIIQYLQQYIKYIWMCLFYFIKEDNAVRFTAYSFCQLATFIIANITWRRSDKTSHRMLLHVLTHINTHHIGLIIEQCLCQCLCKLCFTYTGRS